MKRYINPTILFFCAVSVMALVVPGFLSHYFVDVLITAALIAYMATCWNILGGIAGQFSFGHAAFIGIGAYATTLFYVNLNVHPILGMLAGMAISGILAAVIALLSFKAGLKSVFFALVTFAFAQMIYWFVAQSKFTGGDAGIEIPYVPGGRPYDLIFTGALSYYYIILILLVLSLALTVWIKRSKMGLYLAAVREDEDAAQALGVNALRYKTLAMIISATAIAPAGAFLALYHHTINPQFVMGWHNSFLCMVPALVGGAFFTSGPLVGSIFYVLLSEMIVLAFGTAIPGLAFVVFGVLLIIIMLFAPSGVVGIVQSSLGSAVRLGRKRASGAPPATS